MVSLNRLLTKNSALPWRIRHPLEKWIELRARERYPKLYRFLHLGKSKDIARPVTSGPNHHFFGYYEKSPWNTSGNLLLAHEATFNDRAPKADDRITVGRVDLNNNNQFIPIARSHAWNWQQGSMLQWHPTDPDNLVIYNDRIGKRFVGVAHDLRNDETQIYDQPIYAITPDGDTGFSLNFSRLAQHRPGYGYEGIKDQWEDLKYPENDGIFSLDLESGRAELIVTLASLAELNPKPSMQNAWHYVNHIQVSPSGQSIAFFHIWHQDKTSWEVRLYTCHPNGSDLRCLLDTGTISHYDWRDDNHILIWANKPHLGERFLLCNVPSGANQVFGDGILTTDGHCSYSPDRNWILNDTYPDNYMMRTLMLVQAGNTERIDLARLYSPKERWWGEIRCDLHPRWNRNGTQVCIDSVHSGERQMYIIDVTEYVR